MASNRLPRDESTFSRNARDSDGWRRHWHYLKEFTKLEGRTASKSRPAEFRTPRQFDGQDYPGRRLGLIQKEVGVLRSRDTLAYVRPVAAANSGSTAAKIRMDDLKQKQRS
jgi:hypothetical protein